jgi:signal transduction histidine kinase
MLSGVVHDLRTPMTIIRGYAELMEAEPDAKQRSEHAEVIARQFDHLHAMVGETLAFARGERALLLRKVHLYRFLEEVEEQLRVEFEPAGVELRVDASYQGPARLDEGKMKRLVHNIARNAQQAMPNGGRFVFAVERDGDALVLRFSDTGTGIPPEIADHLFESFVTAGKPGGTGLGLAIVKQVAEEHGGGVTFKSRPGKGTTFEVRVPLGLKPEAEE